MPANHGFRLSLVDDGGFSASLEDSRSAPVLPHRRRIVSGDELDTMVATLAANAEPHGEPRKRRTVSGLSIMPTPVMEPPATRRALLRGISVPDIVRSATPDLRVAQTTAGVVEATRSIQLVDELLASLASVETTLRFEVEWAEEALREHDSEPAPAVAEMPNVKGTGSKQAANSEANNEVKRAPQTETVTTAVAAKAITPTLADPAAALAAAVEEEEAPPETDPDRLALLVGQTLEVLTRLRFAVGDADEVEQLRQAQRAGTRLLAWLAGAKIVQRQRRSVLAARRATYLRAEAMTVETVRTRQRYARESAAARAAIIAQDAHHRDARAADAAARALVTAHSAPGHRTFVECAWRENQLAEKRLRAGKVRREYGRLFVKTMRSMPRATAAEVLTLSASLNRKMQALQKRDGSVSFFKLFNHMDDNGSGKLSYVEFVGMVRNDLVLSLQELTERKLKSIWLALDTDSSGFITVGELGAFVRLGEGAEPSWQDGATLKFVNVAWRDNVLADRRQEAGKVRRELGRLLHQDIRASMLDAPHATVEEMRALSASLNRKMHALQEREGVVSFFKLFNHMDDDGSGQLSYVEFAGMVREELGLSRQELTERKLKSIWLALDTDSSGLITAGELGAFVRLSEGAESSSQEGEARQPRAKLFFPSTRGAIGTNRKGTRARTGEQAAPTPPRPTRGITSSASLPELGATQRARLQACGGADFRPAEPSGGGAAVLNRTCQERQQVKRPFVVPGFGSCVFTG